MDDFRVGSISQYEPYREDRTPGRRQRAPDGQEDGFASTVEEAEAETEAEAGAEAGAEPQDYYTPSERPDE
jgi:hypothetical protein